MYLIAEEISQYAQYGIWGLVIFLAGGLIGLLPKLLDVYKGFSVRRSQARNEEQQRQIALKKAQLEMDGLEERHELDVNLATDEQLEREYKYVIRKQDRAITALEAKVERLHKDHLECVQREAVASTERAAILRELTQLRVKYNTLRDKLPGHGSDSKEMQ